MKRKTYIPILLGVLLLAGCGKSGGQYSSAAPADAGASNGIFQSSSAESFAYDASAEYSYEYGEAEESKALSDADKENSTLTDVIKKEMLVYSCNMTVDVLDFEDAVNTLKNNLDFYGAFVESEQYSDGGSTGRWHYSDSEKWQKYTATIRVPSKDYDTFCNSAAGLGDLRSKTADVKNLSREYYDLSATLDIYEAKEERYMELLHSIKDEQYAIAVEEQLTNIQIEISKLKTRMNEIQTDVAYSYVYLTINEVKEYMAEPVKTDTFLQRLGNTVSDATSSFLSFMEGLLFALIYLFPHLVIIGLIVFVIVKAVRAGKKRKAAKKAAADAQPAASPAPEAEAKETESKENKS